MTYFERNGHPRTSDARFIAEFRNALPELLDELERLRAREVEARELIKEAHFCTAPTCRDRDAWRSKRNAYLAATETEKGRL